MQLKYLLASSEILFVCVYVKENKVAAMNNLSQRIL